jgi:hypothetical protein
MARDRNPRGIRPLVLLSRLADHAGAVGCQCRLVEGEEDPVFPGLYLPGHGRRRWIGGLLRVGRGRQ